MKIFVTGGAGFIGCNLCARLLRDGYEVLCFDNFNDYYSPSIKKRNIVSFQDNPRFQCVVGDISDSVILEKIFKEHTIDTVIHLAAKAGVQASLSDPQGFSMNNIIGTFHLLEMCKKYKIHNFIFASSSSVYGNNKKVPFSEEDNVDFPISPYAVTKKTNELFCFQYHHLYNLNVVCLRFFTVYGPHNRPDMAHFTILSNILAKKPIQKYGDENSMRDYTYIDDIVEGIVACIGKTFGFEIVNLGNSQPISLDEMIRTLEEIAEVRAIVHTMPLRAGDVDRTYADISKANKVLKWSPKTNYVDGVRELVRWYKSIYFKH